MIEETKKILEELIAPPDLIQQFVALLKEKKIGVEQRDDRRAKYFLATNTDKKILVLAHESSKDGWWGIGGDLIEELGNWKRSANLTLRDGER